MSRIVLSPTILPVVEKYDCLESSCLRKVQRTTYIPKELYAKLEKYSEPNKPTVSAIQKLLDIAERRETLVVVMRGKKICCNKMKHLQEPNRVYCRMLETIASVEFCMKKCVVAPILKELSEEGEPSKPKTASLEGFLYPPKLEHLTHTPKTQKDR